MAYRLKAKESIPEGIKRVVLEEIQCAGEQLRESSRSKRDEAIHEARKSVKKIRGALRLVRPELGKVYRDENSRFQELGRKLSELRDAAAIVEVFDSVTGKYKDELRNNGFAAIRRGLQKNKRDVEKSIDFDKLVKGSRSTLRAATRRVKAWPLKADGFGAIAPGLQATYKAGRKALAVTEQNQEADDYHYFRRRLKDHWYHVRLLESLWTEVMQAHESSLKQVETWLGDDHNLVVLCERLSKQPEDYGDQKDIELFLALAKRFQDDLRANAVSFGKRIYEQKPRQFVQNMSKLWDAWQSQPDSAKQVEKEQRKPAKKQPGQASGGKTKAA